MEIGITIPRKLFDNNLDGLIAELKEIRFILRAFSEVSTGSVEPVILRQISTTDPLFFLGMPAETIAAVGAAVTWVLSTWRQIEEIRNVRAETQNLQFANCSAVLLMFDAKI